MTESMIERVMAGMKRAKSEWRATALIDTAFPADRDAYERHIARAAIEAMREPTDAMWKMVFDEDMHPHDEDLNTYQALIDAALRCPAGSADKAGVPMARDQ